SKMRVSRISVASDTSASRKTAIEMRRIMAARGRCGPSRACGPAGPGSKDGTPPPGGIYAIACLLLRSGYVLPARIAPNPWHRAGTRVGGVNWRRQTHVHDEHAALPRTGGDGHPRLVPDPVPRPARIGRGANARAAGTHVRSDVRGLPGGSPDLHKAGDG